MSTITFEDNRLLPQLYGEEDCHLRTIESMLGVTLSSRGNTLAIDGDPEQAAIAVAVLRNMYEKIKSGMDMGRGEVGALIRMIAAKSEKMGKKSEVSPDAEAPIIRTPRKHVSPFSQRQAHYMEALLSREMIFASGPAGTGKTFLAVAAAASFLMEGQVERIILSRPAVEAGEKLGFLPGDMREKVDPYLRPIYDALHAMMPSERILKSIETGAIEIAPLAFMRGRTLRHSFVILDEAQNTTPTQMKMFLTRLGDHSRMVITGDLSQTDLPEHVPSGFRDALDKLRHLEEIAVVHFTAADVVRHPLTQKIVEAYEASRK